MNFIQCVQGELLKLRHSATMKMVLWLVGIGQVLGISAMIFAHAALKTYAVASKLDMTGVTLSVSLGIIRLALVLLVIILIAMSTQIEFRNKTWKQVALYPWSFASVYFSKLLVSVSIIMLLFGCIIVASLVTGTIADLIVFHKIPLKEFMKLFTAIVPLCFLYILALLPVIALQQMLGFQFSNPAIPIMVTTILWALPKSTFGNFVMYVPLQYVGLLDGSGLNFREGFSANSKIIAYSLVFFLIFIVIGYVLELTRENRLRSTE